MLFPTFDFLVFFIVVFAVAWALSARATPRKLFLTAASYFFYGWWDWRFMALLFASSLINYLGGLAIARGASVRAKKWAVGLTVALNLCILGFFKYYEFFITSLEGVLTSLGFARDLPLFEVILPVGISFFTFQGISYVVDVYRGHVPARRSLLDVMLYISFFPQLVAGPIVRAAQFLPQLDRRPDPRRILVTFGVLLIAWGLFKKAIVANYLAVDLVDRVFMDPDAYHAADLLLAVYGYAVQIYCDFSAYSDIAIGVAALLGYSFPRNFDQPYRAQSVAEFWRRWHISLSSWLRDYLYIPLGGNRKGRVRTYVNLSLTMLLGGLWHGAAWRFVLWGALHGGALAVERFLTSHRDATESQIARGGAPLFRSPLLSTLFVFHFVCFCWIFFRAQDMDRAGAYIAGFATNWQDGPLLFTPLSVMLVALGIAINFIPRDSLNRVEARARRLPWWVMGLAGGLLLALFRAFGMDGTAPFIYFQF